MRLKITVSTLLLVTILFAGCGIGARIKKADKRFEVGEYATAGDLYKGIYPNLTSKEKSLRGKIAFRQAECYRLTNNSRAEHCIVSAKLSS